MVVIPSFNLLTPAIRRVSMPRRMASLFISIEEAPASISSLISSLIGITSYNAMRPLNPVLLHKWQPVPCIHGKGPYFLHFDAKVS